MSDQANSGTKAGTEASTMRSDFVDVVGKTSDVQETGTPEERRAKLIAYRQRVEQARQAQEDRLNKLADAQRRIEAELEAFDRREADQQARLTKLAEEARAAEAESKRIEAQRLREAEDGAREAERARAELEQRAAARAAEAKRLEEESKRIEADRLALAAQQKEQEEAMAREAAAQAKVLEERRRQVAVIQQHYVATAATTPAATTTTTTKAAAPAKTAPAPAPAPAKTVAPAVATKPATPAAAKPAAPAKPATTEKIEAPPPNMRRTPRFEIHAVVSFGAAPNDIVMRAKNISMTGALLATEAGTAAKFAIGSEHDASVFLTNDPKERVTLRSSVVRHDGNDIVIDWSNDVEASFRVALLIATLPPT